MPQRRHYVRRKAKKIERNAYQRENVLTDRDCLPQSQRALTETERAANSLPRKQEKVHTYRTDNYEGNYKINHHDYSEVVTHPVTTEKDSNHKHQPLSSPSHLWCDVVSATDKDCTVGARYQTKILH